MKPLAFYNINTLRTYWTENESQIADAWCLVRWTWDLQVNTKQA